MKSRWLLNLALLVLVGGIALFLYLRPQPVEQKPQAYPLSTISLANVRKVTIEVPAKKPVRFEKQDGRWRMVEPYQARADLPSVGRIISIAGAVSKIKLPATDLGRFGLDNPTLKVRLDDQEFSFGMYNPVGGEQFVAYKDAVYAVPTVYAEGASVQPLELLNKMPLDNDEQIVGFDLSGLEQWESSRLQLDLQPDGKWKVSSPKAKPDQNEINQWLANGWQNLKANTVEPYTLDRNPHPYLVLRLKGGKTVRLIKMQESPELLLVREDQKMLYHFPQDTGFEILNPPVGFKPE
jgi:hypothetical protein